MGAVVPNPDDVPTVEEETLDLDETGTYPKIDSSEVESVSEHVDAAGAAGSDGRTKNAAYSRGERRRKAKKPETHHAVTFDDKGNAVLQWAIDVPRRREGDDTLDLLEALNPDDLALTDEGDAAASDSESDGFNPYNKNSKPKQSK